MPSFTGTGASWFVVVPDTAAGTVVARRLGGRVLLAYESGRPCLAAGVTDSTRVVVGVGRVGLAVIGEVSVTARRLESHARQMTSVHDADGLADRIAGSFALVALADGVVRVQGTASGVRRVYHAEVETSCGRSRVVSDRAVLLARLTDAPVDIDAVATRMLPRLPAPLSRPMWTGVAAVDPGSAIHLGGQTARLRTWWAVPEAELPLAEGAASFAAALSDAVATRFTHDAVASDLSGGLDSTPLSFLADAAARHRAGSSLITFSQNSNTTQQQDAGYRAAALRHLSGTHVSAEFGELSAWFAGTATPLCGLDEPLPTIRSIARITDTARLLAQHGARVHLTGHGGDEITHLPLSYLHGLARGDRTTFRAHLRAARARKRWGRRACARALADRRDYGTWLADQAALLTGPMPAPNQPDFGWEMPLRLPAWATPAAVDTVARHLRTAADRANALSPVRAQHQTLSTLRANAASYGSLATVTARVGATMCVPYLDDHVITAALAVRLDERASTSVFKPLTVAAMRPHMPPQFLSRVTKDEFSDEFYHGLRAHRDQLADLAQDSLLVRTGLADEAAVARMCAATPVRAGGLDAIGLDVFIALENWLRAQRADP